MFQNIHELIVRNVTTDIMTLPVI